jgi:ubiquinone biosynthesis protein COQ4
VHYIDDPELAYVMQRYRESHDLYHCLCSMPVSVTYELALKFFEFANLGLPMTGLSAAFGHLRLSQAQRTCLMSVYWEERWAQNIEEMKRELGVWDPPPAKWPKALNEAKAAAAKKQAATPTASL